ncbi:MAG: FG-GAP repeat domain-containing protein [Phycisphaerae bacterium]
MTGTLRMPKYRRTTIYTGPPSERVLLVTGDINADGNDEIVIAGRIGSEGLWWLEREDAGRWQAHLMDDQYERLDAGGVLYDIDGDGRLDFLAGGDHANNALLWWQCPEDPQRPWTRRKIFRMPENQSHDQVVADIDGDGRPEVYFWNQGSKTLFVAPIPQDPTVSPWPGVSRFRRERFG